MVEKPEQLSLAEFQIKTFPVLLIFCLPRTFYQGPELPPPPFSTFKTSGTDMTHWHFPHSSSAVDLWPSDKMESMFKHFLHWNLRLRCLPSLRENLFNKRQFLGEQLTFLARHESIPLKSHQLRHHWAQYQIIIFSILLFNIIARRLFSLPVW